MDEEEKLPKEQLRIVYGEILRGFNLIDAAKYRGIVVKHLTVFDTELVDQERELHFQRAVKEGLPSEKARLKELERESLWGVEQEKKIEETESYVSRMRESKSKLLLKSQAQTMQDEIDAAIKELNAMRTEREEMLGLTSERHANKKANDYYVYISLYKDREFKDRFFSDEEFDDVSDVDLNYLVLAFNAFNKRYSQMNLKRTALSHFFLNNFYLCDDNPFSFYGKPVVELTYHQAELFSHGKYFKHILQNMKHSPPADIMEDPDRLMEAYNVDQNREKLYGDKDQSGVGSTVVGATKDDLEALGMTSDTAGEPVVSLSDAVKEAGGRLEMEDLIKLHGV